MQVMRRMMAAAVLATGLAVAGISSAGEPSAKQEPAATTGHAAAQPEAGRAVPPTARHTRNIEGWTVRVDDRLFSPPDEELGSRAIQFLQAKLADITYVVPGDKLQKLRTVCLVMDLNHGNLHSMQYHPSADWLQQHGYARDLARCVHIPEAEKLVTSRNVREQPWAVLHELAHAYHDQVLGFGEPRIKECYERFQRSGHGDAVLRFDGKRARHYALTDHKEFFAEMTESYFGMNDFFPFNRAELMTSEPEIYDLLRSIWESDRAAEVPTANRDR
jgi:hypothetical protein